MNPVTPTTKPIVNMALLGNPDKRPDWPLGEVWHVERSPRGVFDLVRQHSESSSADAWLFWDSDLGTPHSGSITAALSLPGDVWHAGLRLGLGGLPGLINFVHPTWMLNRDPDSNKVATSWRLSLRACLVRTSVLRHLGSVCPDFESLEGASLEMGHRYLVNGVISRHVPWLVQRKSAIGSTTLPFADEWLFIFHRMGRKWTYWALGRALFTGYAGSRDVLDALLKLRGMPLPPNASPFRQVIPTSVIDASTSRVTVLIPTLDRYEYLRRLLPQLRNQTIPPIEIILVDQTPMERRLTTLAEDYLDLPLKILYQEHPGQCSARNTGLRIAQGDYILFLDDDDEVPPDLIEAHLRSLQHFQTSVSCGVADEVGPIRCSDIFPSNNALVHRAAMDASGLFDVAYDGDWADDTDLGMRMYLNGTLMILNPAIRVLHHHAPQGGLRTHGAHVTTFAGSRISLTQRQLPSATEIYLWKRYFTHLQTKEALLISTVGTLSFHGNPIGRALKFIWGIFLLPHTLWKIRKNSQRADRMLQHFPQIPLLTNQQTTEAT